MDYRNEGQLTVRELIAQLRKMPQDALVWHEGCDCSGAANGVEWYRTGDDPDDDANDPGTVLITRCN